MFLVGATTTTGKQPVPKKSAVHKAHKVGQHKQHCEQARPYVIDRRSATWSWQDKLLVARTKTAYAERRINSCGYLKWQGHLWAGRADHVYRQYAELKQPAKAICYVFGVYCQQALAVASCESGHAYSINAHNGQYLGMFQMGSSERATYGHGDTPLEQALAAHRYFIDSGKDWSPWSCKP